ncbi:MAG TPA: SIR2 family protein [Gemmatimonadaceae bacterium]|nr:SIR2 family protein [Gemmatimonadaceae bacterium]
MPTDLRQLLDDYGRDVHTIESLANTLRVGNALALVGAGFSVRAGYPTWNSLVESLKVEAEAGSARRKSRPSEPGQSLLELDMKTWPEQAQRDVLWRAQKMRDHIGERRYRALMRRTFTTPPKRDECLDIIARLPFRHYLTTNYDRSLGTALTRERGEAPQVKTWTIESDALDMMRTFLDDGAKVHLVHLHGRISKIDSLVLTDHDYTQLYLRSDSNVRKLFALFALRRVVFFGFSLDDPDLSAILRQVTGSLGYSQARHFAILGIEKGQNRQVMRERLQRKFGIDAIFYDSMQDHRKLVALMRALEEMVRPDAVKPGLRRSPGRTTRSRVTKERAPRSAVELGLSSELASAPKASASARSQVARRHRINPDFPDDPRKLMFGGARKAGGRTLEAKVTARRGDPGWFDVELRVTRDDGAPPLRGDVTFYLHPSFDQTTVTRKANGKVARLEVTCYGAFTVGVLADGKRTQLEYDLAKLPGAPKAFREN